MHGLILDDVNIVAAALDCETMRAQPNGGGSILIQGLDFRAISMPIHVNGTEVWWCYQEFDLSDPESINVIRREALSCLHRVIHGDCEAKQLELSGCIHVRKSAINP